MPPLPAVRVWLRLLSCANLVETRVRGGLRRRFATTLPRFDVLAQLDHAHREGADGLTMSELSRRLMVSNGNLTGLTERLRREGLVSRAPARDDRRAQVVRLTPAGRRALAAMAPEHHAWIEAMFEGLDERDREMLYRLLGKLKTSVEGLPVNDRPVESASA
ncbi:MAG TPA: MarR family transcriptional regulator [Gemmatimonadaceae bacterium]|nr:MarR family transcriptional regulator [Gemmatimonadaceae bacterium]